MRRKTTARLSVGLLDQFVSSGSNFVITLVAARTLSPTDFGSFSVAVVLAMSTVGLCRALCSEAILVRPGDEPDTRAERVVALISSAWCVGLVASAAFAATAALSSGTLSRCVVVVAVLIPFVLLQDTLRLGGFAHGRPQEALASDVVWVVAMVAGYVVVHLRGPSAPLLLVAWMASGALAGILHAAHRRVRPHLSQGFQWVLRHRDLSGPYALTFVSTQGSGYVSSLLLAASAGVAEAGAVRGAIALYGPINVLFGGAYATLVPEGRRVAETAPRRLLKICQATSVVLALVAAALTAVLVALPANVGEAILGATWYRAQDLIPFVGVAAVASGVISGALVGLSTLTEAGRILRTRIIMLPTTIGLPVVGGYRWGGVGLAIGLAVANWITVAALWRDLMRSIARRAAAQAPT